MRIPASGVVAVSLMLPLCTAGCGGGGEAPATQDSGAPTLSVQPAGGPPAVTAMITYDAVADTITVSPDPIEVKRGAVVRFESVTMPDSVWMVAFTDGTPFRGGNPNDPHRLVFHGGGRLVDAQGPIDRSATLQEYKYWVFHPNGKGGYKAVDPKLIVIDDGGGMGTDSASN